MDRHVPTTRHARVRQIRADAWLAALQLRAHADAGLVSDALELLAETLAETITDRRGLHLRVADLAARALARWDGEPALRQRLQAIADTGEEEPGHGE